MDNIRPEKIPEVEVSRYQQPKQPKLDFKNGALVVGGKRYKIFYVNEQGKRIFLDKFSDKSLQSEVVSFVQTILKTNTEWKNFSSLSGTYFKKEGIHFPVKQSITPYSSQATFEDKNAGNYIATLIDKINGFVQDTIISKKMPLNKTQADQKQKVDQERVDSTPKKVKPSQVERQTSSSNLQYRMQIKPRAPIQQTPSQVESEGALKEKPIVTTGFSIKRGESIAKSVIDDQKNLAKTLKDETKFFEGKVILPQTLFEERKISTIKRNKQVVEHVKVPDNFRLTGYSFEGANGEIQVKQGYIVPISLREAYKHAKPEDRKKADHLFNCYVSKEGKFNQIVMRTGIVNSQARVDELKAVLKKVTKEKKPIASSSTDLVPRVEPTTIRFVSHQLNSFANESKMIDVEYTWADWIKNILRFILPKKLSEVKKTKLNNQHQCIYSLDKEKINGIDLSVAHLNMQSNRVYYSKVGEIAFRGEKRSKKLNTIGLATYVNWFLEDYGKEYDFNLEFMAVDVKTGSSPKQELDKLKEMREDLLSAIQSGNTPQINKLRNQLQEQLKIVRGVLSKYVPKKGHARQVWQLLDKLIELQTSDRENMFQRGQEFLLVKRLNEYLGVISQTNCKSGLDRTGLVHAIDVALKDIEEKKVNNEPITNEMIDEMILKWDTLTAKINKGESPPQKGLVELFRNNILYHMVKTELVITQLSTGLVGFKWHPGKKKLSLIKQENLHPLNFLPAQVTSTNKQKEDLVVYDNKGLPKQMAKAAYRLLAHLSTVRKG